MLPHDLPPAKTVYDYFNKWSADGTWERLNGNIVRRVRQSEGRDPEPSAAIIDSQSVKTTEKGANAATIQPRK
jgi:transposase